MKTNESFPQRNSSGFPDSQHFPTQYPGRRQVTTAKHGAGEAALLLVLLTAYLSLLCAFLLY